MPLPTEILETLPEEMQSDETLSRFNDVAALAKSYLEARSSMGGMIRIPSEDAPEDDQKAFLEKLVNNAPQLMYKPDFSEAEQRDEFYASLGRPETPDGYDLGEDIALDENVLGELKQVGHAIGLTPDQMNKMVGAFSEREGQRKELVEEAVEQATGELKQKWGVTFESRVNAAQKINEQFYPGRDFAQLTPAEIEGLYNVHVSLTGKGAPAAGDDSGGTQGMTPQEAKERAEEIMRKVHDPNSDLSHDEIMRLMKKRTDLLVKYAGYSDNVADLRARR